MSNGVKEELEVKTAQAVSTDPAAPQAATQVDTNPSQELDAGLQAQVTVEKIREKIGAENCQKTTDSLEAHRELLKSSAGRELKGSALAAAIAAGKEHEAAEKKAPPKQRFSLRSLFVSEEAEVYIPTILDKLMDGIANLLKKLERALTQSNPDLDQELEKPKVKVGKAKKKKSNSLAKKKSKRKKTGFYNLDKDIDEEEEMEGTNPSPTLDKVI